MRDPMRVDVHVTVETRKGGDYYFDHDDLARHVTGWIEGGLDDRDDLAKVTIQVLPPGGPGANTALAIETAATSSGACPQCGTTGACNGGPCAFVEVPEELREPDNPAAHALAQHIADHRISEIQAAFRELGWRISFEVQEDTEPEPGPPCSENPNCDSRCCASPHPDPLSFCTVCQGMVGWVDSPTGGWWAHASHPADGHDAQPDYCGCSAALVPQDSAPVEPCVMHGAHDGHRTAKGQRWRDLEAG